MAQAVRRIFQSAPRIIHGSLYASRGLSVTASRGVDLPARTAPPGLITVEETEDVSAISGHPAEEIMNRRIRIYQPAKNAMQSGTANIHNWHLEFETQERWENPLMGWSSTADPLSNMRMEFHTSEEAVAFCEKHGWDCFVDRRTPVKPKVKSYGANFSWNRNTRTSTK